MGKKDASANRGTPVEKYRKDIGKQDYKKSKKEVKMMKNKADMKSSALGIKEVVMIVAALFTLVAGVYMFLFWRLSNREVPGS
ncbi:triple QxxK/R motif-containing protein-like [Saccostrea cucullata]|uniref:triple QxxK/R motif-containing protein-like n=1 Tax=Saccostrea cuccullata TaxID=36930 RepID=UPI002ECFC5F1